MGFRLHPQRPLKDEIPRVILELVDHAHEQLRLEGAELHAGIHEARKDFKKTRATLRLVRSTLGTDYELESRTFRDLGRALSGTRDAEAMIEAFASLVEEEGQQLRPDVVQRTQAHLLERRDELVAAAIGLEALREEIRGELERARQRIRAWDLQGEGFVMIEEGMRKAFGAARRMGQEALVQPSPASFHEWRKRSKIHWYHTRLMADVWSQQSVDWREGLDRLNEILGDYQDIELLIELTGAGIPGLTRFESDHLRQILCRRQKRLRDDATLRGAPYLAERPRTYIARVREAWMRA